MRTRKRVRIWRRRQPAIGENAAWAKPESEKAIWDIASKYPSVMETPEFGQIVKQFDTAGAAAIRAKEAENRATNLTQRNELLAAQNVLKADALAVTEDKYMASNNRRNIALRREI